MEEARGVAQRAAAGDESARSAVKLAGRLILALDHFSAEERDALVRAVQAFARGDMTVTRLPDAEPLYLLRATPDLLAVVRREAGLQLVVEDIASQAALDAMTHAG